MNRSELEQIRDASGLLNQLLLQLNNHLIRTCPGTGKIGSQGPEDQILLPLLPGKGTYIDFGAAKPKGNSNTWAFFERGWRGLLVEPVYLFHEALMDHRPGDLLYGRAVRNYTGETLINVRGEVSSVKSDWTSGEQDARSDWKLCKCMRTDEMLALFPQVRDDCRFCSVDVEGAETELLETIDWGTFHPEVFCIEYRLYDPEKLGQDISAQWWHILEEQGYKEVARTDLNLICQKQETTDDTDKSG